MEDFEKQHAIGQHATHGGGNMAARVRALDWSTTPLGPREHWSPTLKTLVELLLNSQQPMFLAWGAERTWIYNDAFIPIAGSKHPASLGRPSQEVWSEAWRDLHPLFERVFSGEPVHLTGFSVGLDRSGTIEDAYFDFSYTPIRAEHEAVQGLFGVCIETTARVLAERNQLAMVERDRMRIFELSRDLFAVATFEGFLKAINPAWSQQLNRPEAELLSRPFSEIIHPDDLAATGDVVAALQSGQPVHQFHVRLLKADGTPIAFAWSAVPEAQLGGGLFYTVGRDITAETAAAAELRAAQEALRQSQKMEAVGQLTGGIAHDFNNLLGGITGSLQLLEKLLTGGRLDGFERYIDMAQASTRRAAALTQRLLAFSRRQTLDARPTDVNRLVAGMDELIRRSVGPSVAIEVVPTPGLWLTTVDAAQLESALLNLVLNARDAMPDGGRITVETLNRSLDAPAAKELDLAPGPYVLMCLGDTGTGMTAEVAERAFDPFYTTKPLGQGTGLGLSMVHGFARQSGGQAHIRTELGQGTSVCLYLPRFVGELDMAVSPDRPVASGGDAHGESVLVIDDEESIRSLISEVLREAGYRVLEAQDGPSGLKLLESDARIDLLVTDVGLPGGMNGRQVADAARVKREGLKVLFVTGYAEGAAVGNGRLAPGMAVMTKPFDLDVFIARVRDIIRG